ncbi:MAG: site-specific DNA-methyltransferase, partial [Micromonosporaceae bacterium]|nr:site-specific DNA-methyltransferase [Micromonosporaceae bacterium]
MDTSRVTALLDQGWRGSVWLTGQTCSREQRRGRYAPVAITHPAKMLPAIARQAIDTYTVPGDLVADPMA